MINFPCDFGGAFLCSFACCVHSILFNQYNSPTTRWENSCSNVLKEETE